MSAVRFGFVKTLATLAFAAGMAACGSRPSYWGTPIPFNTTARGLNDGVAFG